MAGLVYLIPVALFLGGLRPAAFFSALRSGPDQGLRRAAHRILFDEEPPEPPAR